MYCTRCGVQLADSAQFCTSCGKPVSGVTGAPGPESDFPRRRLHRIREGKKVAGVCAGFAEYFEMDVTIMRLIWIALALLPPSVGVIAYIVAWIAMPVD